MISWDAHLRAYRWLPIELGKDRGGLSGLDQSVQSILLDAGYSVQDRQRGFCVSDVEPLGHLEDRIENLGTELREHPRITCDFALDFVHSVHKTEVMSSAYVSGRVPTRYERLVAKQARAAKTSKSDLVARYVIEKSLETEFPGISFRNSLAGREAYLTGHRVAVWEVVAVHEEAKSVEKTAAHFRWPRVLVRRALAYARAFSDEIGRAREGETDTLPVAG